jgi:plasmid maintenance system killer protein
VVTLGTEYNGTAFLCLMGLPYCVKRCPLVFLNCDPVVPEQGQRDFFRREFSRRFQHIARVAKRKLDQIHAAKVIADLGAVPGNRLETLAGDRLGQYSIRVKRPMENLLPLG